MDLVHSFLNLVLPPAAIIGLFLIWPIVAFCKSVSWVFHLFNREELRGKVVVITGASSGIGEHIAYEYAKRGAKLVLSARRESRLYEVAERAKSRGASDAIVVQADVTKESDCKDIIDAAINHYGRLDHLVCNAGVANSFFFGEAKATDGFRRVLDSIFWGSVYPTYYALPYLRRSRGRIVVVASVAAWLPYPRQSVYNAAKAAELQFFDSLRLEEKGTVDITIAMPGWVESEMTQGKFVSPDGDLTLTPEQRYEHIGPFLVLRVTECAKTIVCAAERRMRYAVTPFWYLSFLPYRILVPEIIDFSQAALLIPRQGKSALSKTIVDKTQITKLLYPETLEQKKA